MSTTSTGIRVAAVGDMEEGEALKVPAEARSFTVPIIG